MEKQYVSSISSNVSQILIWASMLLFSAFYYPTIWSDILIVVFLFLAGLLLFFKADTRFFHLIVYSEMFIAPLEYYYFFRNIFLLLALYLVLIIGVLKRRMDIAGLISVLIVGLMEKPASPFGTDELMIDYYSAYIFLHGLNPYNPELTSNVYHFFDLSPYIYGTPYTTGGFVTNLNYPSLSFLLLIPAVIFKFNPNYIILFFYFLLPVILWRKLDKNSFLLFISAYFFNAFYLFYATGGIDDIIWITFLILSYLMKDVRLKGIFYGLSISYKQDPLLFLPFYLIQLRREKQSLSKFLLFSFIPFLVTNSYFIFLSPSFYFHDLITPMFDNLLQIGFSVDIFSVVGFFYEYRYFFLFSQIVVLLLGIYLYYTKKVSNYFGFIYFVMFFMYRMLWNYIMYLPFFSFLDTSSSSKISIRKEVISPVTVAFLLILSLFFVFHYGFSLYYSSIHIDVIHVYSVDGKIYKMILNVSYTGDGKIKPLFRLFSVNALHDGNGLIWLSNSTWISKGEWEIVEIYPPCSNFAIQNDSSVIINAYYGDMNGLLTFNFT